MAYNMTKSTGVVECGGCHSQIQPGVQYVEDTGWGEKAIDPPKIRCLRCMSR